MRWCPIHNTSVQFVLTMCKRRGVLALTLATRTLALDRRFHHQQLWRKLTYTVNQGLEVRKPVLYQTVQLSILSSFQIRLGPIQKRRSCDIQCFIHFGFGVQ